MIFGLALIPCLTAPAYADPRPVSGLFTLQQAVARAQTAAFDVRIAQSDAAMAAADANSARASLRPQISVSANVLDANQPQLGMPISRQAYGAASLSIPVWAPSNSLTARAAADTALAARTSASATESDAIFATVQAYRRIQLADAVLAARRTAVVDQQEHLRRTEERVSAGKSARYLTARDRAALASAQQAEEDGASERDQAAFDFDALLDLNQGPIAVEPLERGSTTDTPDAVLARALRQRPALLAAEQRVNAAQAAIGAARAAYRPTASLTASSYNGNSSPYLGRSGGQVLLNASLPIVDGGSRGAAAARTSAEYDRAVAIRDQIRAGVARDVGDSWREYEAAGRNLATATNALADAEEQLRIASLRESVGKAIDLEVLDALAVAASARESVVRNVARYDIAIAAIHHAAGDLSP
jgi:outer membrane protein